MALTITGVSDARWYLGPSLQVKMMQMNPASSDYVVGGGYTITAEQCEFGNGHIYGAVLMNQEYSTSNAPVYQVNLPSTSYSTTNVAPSTTQFNVSAWWSGATGALLQEVTTGTDLSSYPFWLLVFGY
jgi:hypothetical protein